MTGPTFSIVRVIGIAVQLVAAVSIGGGASLGKMARNTITNPAETRSPSGVCRRVSASLCYPVNTSALLALYPLSRVVLSSAQQRTVNWYVAPSSRCFAARV